MARDNSPSERQKKQLERKLGRRASYDRILIVSEGSKTEPNYFKEIRAAHRLQTANVEVQPGELGTQPIQVVQYAKSLFENGDRHKQIQPRAFEQVYAVFDRDDHRTYFDALQLAESLDGKLRNDNKQPVSLKAIASVPCFELWLLLHYEQEGADPSRRSDAPAEAASLRLRERRGRRFCRHPRQAGNRYATGTNLGDQVQRLHRPGAIHRHSRASDAADQLARLNPTSWCAQGARTSGGSKENEMGLRVQGRQGGTGRNDPMRDSKKRRNGCVAPWKLA